MTTDQARRRTLRLAVLCLAGSAGCTTDSTGTDGPTARDGTDWNDPTDADASGTDAHPTTGGQEAAPSETSVTATDAGETETDRTADDLDLREANVTEVAVEETGSGCEFAVTLYHDDDGEDGYANWWQVETPDGDRLGRRDLLHAHSTEPFTRSETIDVPDDVSCVVVRGHDQTHEYGGQAMLIVLESGDTRPVRQGSDHSAVSGGDCP